MERHPSTFADFTMYEDAARQPLLRDRGDAGLLVTIGGEHQLTTMRYLPKFVPSGSLLVLNTSGTFHARFPNAELPNGQRVTVHFAQMRDQTATNWIVVVPGIVRPGDIVRLVADEVELRLMKPYKVSGVQPSWEDKGNLWLARYRGQYPFNTFQARHGLPIRYPYDQTDWTLDAMQNCFSRRPTSAMMNNGGRNLTPQIMRELEAGGVTFATVEMRTGVGVDQNGMPLPEFVSIDRANARIINAALAQGRQIIPVGTCVVRALDWFYNQSARRVNHGSGWCTNVITPQTGTFANAWLSGLHEPKSTHLAMGAAVMGERVMRDAMVAAYSRGMKFHENGDTHLYLPAHCV